MSDHLKINAYVLRLYGQMKNYSVIVVLKKFVISRYVDAFPGTFSLTAKITAILSCIACTYVHVVSSHITKATENQMPNL